MTFKNINVSAYLSIFGIVFLYIVLSGGLQSMFFLLENDNVKYGYAVTEVLFFIIVTYYINRYYFKKINLKTPVLIKMNISLLIGILIGISIAFVQIVPYRIYAIIKTGMFEYIFMAITFEIFF
jgi:hypothetical protein